MQAYIALLRAVNVGGTGKLPMTELKAMCEAAGFKSVQTYIASGNVVFKSAKTEAQVKAALDAALAAYVGKPVGVLVRTAAEMAAVLAGLTRILQRELHRFILVSPDPGYRLLGSWLLQT